MTTKLSTRTNHRGLTRQQEAFSNLVAQGMEPNNAIKQAYPDQSETSSYGRALMGKPHVRARIATLENQFRIINELNRDSLTVKAIEIADLATENKSYSAAVSGIRLSADLQGLTNSNPVAEATAAFLGFLAGSPDEPKTIETTLTDVTTENE